MIHAERKPVAIVGYSGHSFVVIDILISAGYSVTSYCDLEEKKINPYGLTYLGKEGNVISKLKEFDFFVAIGENAIREKIHMQLGDHLGNPINAIHPGIIHISWSNEPEYYMHLSSLLIHPSYREGFPNVLLQAGALNCPIVCSSIEGNIDIVDHRHTGLLFEVKNKKDLKEKLTFALNNPELMKQYATALRQKVELCFDQQIVHRAILDKYQELLSEIQSQ
jgi:glycosyltransferase involved in cell wall biosynthesis